MSILNMAMGRSIIINTSDGVYHSNTINEKEAAAIEIKTSVRDRVDLFISEYFKKDNSINSLKEEYCDSINKTRKLYLELINYCKEYSNLYEIEILNEEEEEEAGVKERLCISIYYKKDDKITRESIYDNYNFLTCFFKDDDKERYEYLRVELLNTICEEVLEVDAGDFYNSFILSRIALKEKEDLNNLISFEKSKLINKRL